MKIVFDTTTMQVGCAIIQAMYGGIDNDQLSEFPTESWLLAPNDTMGVYEITPKELAQLVQKVKQHYGKQ